MEWEPSVRRREGEGAREMRGDAPRERVGDSCLRRGEEEERRPIDRRLGEWRSGERRKSKSSL